MSKRTIVELIDDLDGSTARNTRTIGLDGADYTVDLNDQHSNDLDAALAPFIAAATKVGRQSASVSRPAPSSRAASERDRLAAVRQWANANGMAVNHRGRIANSVIEAYERAQRPPVEVVELPTEPAQPKRPIPSSSPVFVEPA